MICNPCVCKLLELRRYANRAPTKVIQFRDKTERVQNCMLHTGFFLIISSIVLSINSECIFNHNLAKKISSNVTRVYCEGAQFESGFKESCSNRSVPFPSNMLVIHLTTLYLFQSLFSTKIYAAQQIRTAP